MNLDCDLSKYDEIHHLPADTIDKVDAVHVAQAAAILAMTAWMAAELPARIAPRSSHAQVAAMLAKGDQADTLAFQGFWKP